MLSQVIGLSELLGMPLGFDPMDSRAEIERGLVDLELRWITGSLRSEPAVPR
jgi:hypothetical protein